MKIDIRDETVFITYIYNLTLFSNIYYTGSYIVIYYAIYINVIKSPYSNLDHTFVEK
jgi:hypothetical protein